MTQSAQLTPVPSHSRRVTYILADFIFFFSIHTVFLFDLRLVFKVLY